MALIRIIQTISEILTAGVAVTAFSLLLYALTFNLRDRVARAFALIMFCVVIVFTTEALASTAVTPGEIDLWLRLQWLGIALLPAVYLQFSDAMLATTGKPSRGRRRLAVRIAYVISIGFILTLPFNGLAGPLVVDQPPAPYLQATFITDLFTVFYLVTMAIAWLNVLRAYFRTVTKTSRRRMIYVLVGAAAPALGSFPYLLFSAGFSARHPLIFWSVAAFSGFVVSGLLVMMAYGVAFFGVPWPDRVVKSRLFKWIMRGPVVASIALAITTIVRRTGEAFGLTYNALVPITMVAIILIGEHLITIFAPFAERWLFYGNDQEDLKTVKSLEERLLTRNDLRQFLEMVLAAVCDRLQAPGAYLAAIQPDGLELVATVGKARFENGNVTDEITQRVARDAALPELFFWRDDMLLPIYDLAENGEAGRQLLGVMGVAGVGEPDLDAEESEPLRVLVNRAALALRDRRLQDEVFSSLESLTSQMDYLQRLRAAGEYNQQSLISQDVVFDEREMTQWVKDALSHYWGGPKLTENPLFGLRVVAEAVELHEGSPTNALRSVLREAIDRVKPEGERRFTAEWVLYNILEMKFLEGKKVRDIARRLAMSEADLYRKQRVAIEAVARAILDMESQIRNGAREG